MEYSVQNLSKSKLEISIDITKEEWTDAVQKTYAKTKHKYSVQGFRAGKAPKHLIEQTYGKEVFYNDAIDFACEKYYGEIIEKDNLAVIKTVDLDVREVSDDGLKITLTAIVEPEFELGQYKGLTIKKMDVTVTDEEIEAKIAKERESRFRLIDSENAAEIGNTVYMDFLGKVDDVPFDGGSAENFELELGSHRFIPGFEEQVVGMKVGEVKDIEVTFPEEYQEKTLAGKKAVFTITLHGVKIKEYPEIDDEFAKDIDETVDNLEGWKANISKEIAARKEENAEAAVEEQIIKLISDGTEIEIPELLVEEETDRLVAQMSEQMSMYGLNIDKYLEYTKSTMEDFRKEKAEEAGRYVKERLILTKIIEVEKITIEQNEFEAEFNKLDKEARSREAFNGLYNSMLTKKLFKFLKENNNIE